MSKKVNLTFRVDFRFQLFAEEDKSFASLEFVSLAKALREAVEAMMDGSDAVHDYVGEELPDGVELSSCGVGEVVLTGIGGGGEK